MLDVVFFRASQPRFIRFQRCALHFFWRYRHGLPSFHQRRFVAARSRSSYRDVLFAAHG